ncbi:MAG: tyrosine-type recombinase/integrase, partial [Candidatus Thermoplasmatota archaeon]|nr:tyrosine-type recombinase/integrase [Candidatus Thermoplasmatota archaeon]
MPIDDFESRIKKAKENLEENDKIIDANKETLLEFDRELELNDYSKSRRYKYLAQLPKMTNDLDVPFEEATRDDIEELIIGLKRRDDINDTTKNDYKKLLKRFYKWVNDGEYPDCVSWLEINYNNNNGKLPEEMLVEEDIEELIKNAKNPRDKALISILWETGARIGELVDLTIGSIEDHEHGFKIVVDGKTGSRRIPLIESVPYLNKWLKEHSGREDKTAPLWINIGEVNTGEKMNYRAIRKMLNDVKKRSSVDKPVNPHNFRHSRATYMATRFTEAQMCEWFGWVQGSDVPSKYTHLSGRDIDSDYARLHGIEEEEDRKISKLIPKDCPRCGESVPKEDNFCPRCGQALTGE